MVIQTFGAVMAFISATLFCLAAYRYIVLRTRNRFVLQGLIAYLAHLVGLVVLLFLMPQFGSVTQFAVAFAAPVLLLAACGYFGYRAAETAAGRRLLFASVFLLVSYAITFGVRAG